MAKKKTKAKKRTRKKGGAPASDAEAPDPAPLPPKHKNAQEPSRTERRRLKQEAILFSLKNGATITAATAGARCSGTQFYKWKHDDPEFAAAVEEAEQEAILSVEGQLYNQAMLPTKTQPWGHFGAKVFFLCNRLPSRWRDVKHLEHSGEIKVDSFAALVKAATDEADSDKVDAVTERVLEHQPDEKPN